MIAKELVERRFKNRKIELEEAVMFRLIKKLGYKEATLFYKDIADEVLDINLVLDKYIEMQAPTVHQSLPSRPEKKETESITDGIGELVIERNLKGVDYQFAKCCDPQKGDEIFANADSIHKLGLEEDNQNFLLMHSMAVNVSGQIASVIAGGLILSMFM